jgi:hypothetical protein
LDTELQTQYDNYFTMFRTEGWKQFIEDMNEVYEAYRREDIKDDIDLAKVQGERKILKNILVFEDAIHSTYDALEEDDYDSSL